MLYDYKVIPAPRKGTKARGVKGPEGRFSNALEVAMNELSAEGWEFYRSETLPSDERSGLTGTQTVFRSVLVFRRPRDGGIEAFQPEVMAKSIEEDADAPVQTRSEPQPPRPAPGLNPVQVSKEPEQDWSEDEEADHTRS